MYSKTTGHFKTAGKTTPVWALVVLSFLNRKFNWGLDDAIMGVIVGGIAYVYFFVKNWLKNKNIL
jgi:hypothetical protein